MLVITVWRAIIGLQTCTILSLVEVINHTACVGLGIISRCIIMVWVLAKAITDPGIILG